MSADASCPAVDNIRDLEAVLGKKDRIIALIHATWCPFCRKAVPAFEALAREEERHLLLVADDEERIADLYGVDFFPTLILFEKGIVVRRLDAKPGIGLNEHQIAEFIQSCPLL
ncbi:MAG: thioredoxin family protein [Smithellaceae bacterium]